MAEEEEYAQVPTEQPQFSVPVPVAKKVSDNNLKDILNVTSEDVVGGTEEDLQDVFEVTDEDIQGEGKEDFSDIFDIEEKDIQGYDYAPKPKPQPKFRIAPQQPTVFRRPPPVNMGGLR